MYLNPYTPGAGLVPSYLAGRDDTLNASREILAYLSRGKTKRSIIYYGLRGVCVFRRHPDTDFGNIRTAYRNYPDSVSETSGHLAWLTN